MSKSKLCVTQLEGVHERKFYVRAAGRHMVVCGDLYDTAEEAFAQLRKCEQDEEYLYWAKYYALCAQPNPREDSPMRNMSKYEKAVLAVMLDGIYDESNVFTFQGLADRLGITERQAKTASRALKRRGFAEHSAYWNEDGMLGGSGYMITTAGIWEAKKFASRAIAPVPDLPAVAEEDQSIPL